MRLDLDERAFAWRQLEAARHHFSISVTRREENVPARRVASDRVRSEVHRHDRPSAALPRPRSCRRFEWPIVAGREIGARAAERDQRPAKTENRVRVPRAHCHGERGVATDPGAL